ncbi:ribosome-inactivating family protein [Photorhabdus stackebrandtii]|nr:ribosome-inactivating family protein [Photorhabdus stackebrandtii]
MIRIPIFIMCFFLLAINNCAISGKNYYVDIHFDKGKNYLSDIEAIRNMSGTSNNMLSASGHTVRLTYPFDSLGGPGDSYYRIVRLYNVSREGDNSDGANVQLVMQRWDFYIAGFIVLSNGRSVYHRFEDLPEYPLPFGVSSINTLRTSSNYNRLARVARISNTGPASNGILSRGTLPMSRASLERATGDLERIAPGAIALDEQQARAIISYATVVAEAIRFRVIADDFGRSLDTGADYTLQSTNLGNNATGFSLTLNWEALSGPATRFGGLTQERQPITSVYAGNNNSNIRLTGRDGIASVLAMLAHCAPNNRTNSFFSRPAARGEKVSGGDVPVCSMENVIGNGNRIWDRTSYHIPVKFEHADGLRLKF